MAGRAPARSTPPLPSARRGTGAWPAVGPQIHHARTNLAGRTATDYAPGPCHSLWVIEDGLARLEGAPSGRLAIAAPAAVLLQAGERLRLVMPRSTRWLRVAFDLVRVPLRRGRHPGTWDHVEPAVQPGLATVLGVPVPLLVEPLHLPGCREMARLVIGTWWRDDLGWAVANALLGGWLLEWAARHAPERRAPASPALRAWVDPERVDARLRHGVRVGDLVAQSGRSRQGYGRCFRRAIGTTPGRWLASRRLEAAQDLLRDGAMTVGEAGRAVGFVSASAFCHFFRRHTGTTPAAWRRSIRG